jgi:hypothetical protein
MGDANIDNKRKICFNFLYLFLGEVDLDINMLGKSHDVTTFLVNLKELESPLLFIHSKLMIIYGK